MATRTAVLCGACPTSLSTLSIQLLACACSSGVGLHGSRRLWERGEVRAFMPPPSMDRTRTPRPASGERPTARRTASPSPSTASARVAATRTRACTTPSCARAAGASGTVSTQVTIGSSGSPAPPARAWPPRARAPARRPATRAPPAPQAQQLKVSSGLAEQRQRPRAVSTRVCRSAARISGHPAQPLTAAPAQGSQHAAQGGPARATFSRILTRSRLFSRVEHA